jgi:hypothetical protein
MTDSRQWEYYVETVGSAWKGVDDKALMAVLSELGQSGWEVFSVEQLANSTKIRLVAKRPAPRPAHKKKGWP